MNRDDRWLTSGEFSIWSRSRLTNELRLKHEIQWNFHYSNNTVEELVNTRFRLRPSWSFWFIYIVFFSFLSVYSHSATFEGFHISCLMLKFSEILPIESNWKLEIMNSHSLNKIDKISNGFLHTYCSVKNSFSSCQLDEILLDDIFRFSSSSLIFFSIGSNIYFSIAYLISFSPLLLLSSLLFSLSLVLFISLFAVHQGT